MSAIVNAVAALTGTGVVGAVTYLARSERRSTGRQWRAWSMWESTGDRVPGWHPAWVWSTDQVWRAEQIEALGRDERTETTTTTPAARPRTRRWVA